MWSNFRRYSGICVGETEENRDEHQDTRFPKVDFRLRSQYIRQEFETLGTDVQRKIMLIKHRPTRGVDCGVNSADSWPSGGILWIW